MRLAFAASAPFPHLGGQSTHIADLTRGLRARGHEVAHVSQADLGDAFARWAIHRPSYALDKLSTGLGRRWSYPLLEALLARRLRTLGKVDAVLAQDPIAWHAAKRAMPARTPVLLTAHGYLVMEHLADRTLQPGATADWLQGKEDAAYRGADAIVTVDTRIKEHVLSRGADPSRVTVLVNFVDTDVFSPGVPDARWPGRKVLACPRRLVPKNGVRYAVESAARLGDPFTVVIAGDGPERGMLEAAKPPNCDMIGPVKHQDLPALLRRADVVLVPSVNEQGVEEATSIAALEAMSCARPVVASSIGGLKELIRDGENGILIPQRDADAIAGAVRRLAADPALAERLGRRAREDVLQRYSLMARVDDYLRVVREARGRVK